MFAIIKQRKRSDLNFFKFFLLSNLKKTFDTKTITCKKDCGLKSVELAKIKKLMCYLKLKLYLKNTYFLFESQPKNALFKLTIQAVKNVIK